MRETSATAPAQPPKTTEAQELTMRKHLLLLLTAGLIGLVFAPVAAAKTRVVHHGQSIQAAINAAHPGDTIVVRPGTYRESLEINKDRITLRANGVTLRPPSTGNTFCDLMNGGGRLTGICIVGAVSITSPNSPPTVNRQVRNVHVTGITVRGFSSDGVFIFASNGAQLVGVKLLNNGGYGVFSNTSTRTTYSHDLSRGNGDAGFYIGDSPNARATIKNDRSLNNKGEGVLMRDASNGTVSGVTATGNCAGMLVVADAPGPATHWTLRHNTVRSNNRACPGDPADGEPPFSGIGIGLVGAANTTVTGNTVTGNHAGNPSFTNGGIVVAKGPGGTAPKKDKVSRNTARHNTPFDLLWDRSGTVSFSHNHCGKSSPSRLCH
jgi:nitrous oxidase accessory protein NosD